MKKLPFFTLFTMILVILMNYNFTLVSQPPRESIELSKTESTLDTRSSPHPVPKASIQYDDGKETIVVILAHSQGVVIDPLPDIESYMSNIQSLWSQISRNTMDIDILMNGNVWVELPNPLISYSLEYPRDLVQDAITKADLGYDFPYFDGSNNQIVDHIMVWIEEVQGDDPYSGFYSRGEILPYTTKLGAITVAGSVLPIRADPS
ncbi:MAG: hypothetical protein ACXAB2_12085, partial [Candidatus Hodarchaeales archaeon]